MTPSGRVHLFTWLAVKPRNMSPFLFLTPYCVAWAVHGLKGSSHLPPLRCMSFIFHRASGFVELLSHSSPPSFIGVLLANALALAATKNDGNKRIIVS